MRSDQLKQRAHQQLRLRAQQWAVTIAETWETSGSLLAFGERHGAQVVLKINKQRGDEWCSGEVLRAFDGRGTARVYEYTGGAMLLERLDPGKQLVELVRRGEDDEATAILCEVMRQMVGQKPPEQAPTVANGKATVTDRCTTVMDWARGFDRYLGTGDKQVSLELVNYARDSYLELAASQRETTLLHGDLQHYNVLFDARRGWVAIDPKGVVGEVECEVGAILRNPAELPDVFLSTTTIERRLSCLAKTLTLDYERALSWAFAQAVLSAIWDVEDGYTVPPTHHALELAYTIKPLLDV